MKHEEMAMQITGNNSGNKMYYFNILKYLLCSFVYLHIVGLVNNDLLLNYLSVWCS
jgi:hypothetical protein